MSLGRVLSSCAAAVAVCGCAALAVGMSRAVLTPDDASTPFAMPTTSAPADPTWAPVTSAWAPATRAAVARPPAHPTPAHSTAVLRPAKSTAAAVHPARSHATVPASTPAARPAPKTTPPAAPKPAPQRGQSLPVAGHAPGSTRVLTVTAASYGSTMATLQAWVSAPGGGWLKHGPGILAHVGADGLSSTPSESRSATPIGSFTLTQAFGADSNPGTGLPYVQTNASDWWISQAGPLYNTRQHCSSGCGFTQGAPNEHLAYELPFYNYAVVIDYNTRNAPGGVRAGAGSAFFLHVTDGNPTAGCVAIPQANLVSIMQWLTPSAHPRILIGVA